MIVAIRAPDFAIHDGIDQRRRRQADHHRVDLAAEVFGQAGLLRLVPVLGLLNIELGCSTEEDRKGQGSCLRSRA